MKKENIIKVAIGQNTYSFNYGITLEEILNHLRNDTKEATKAQDGERPDIPIVAAYVNGYLQGLDYTLIASCQIRWVNITSQIGLRIYRHSQRLLLLAAHNTVLPNRQLYIRHSLGSGTFCQSKGETPLSAQELEALKKEMQRLIDNETPITNIPIFSEDAIYFYRQRHEDERADLLEASSKRTMFFHELDTTVEALVGTLATNCRQLPYFDLTFFENGFVLLGPTSDSPSETEKFDGNSRIGSLFNSYDNWTDALTINTISDLNNHIAEGRIRHIVELAETAQLQSICEIVKDIIANIDNNRLILIAGPSSSGKTTLSHRLSVFFQINGIEPVTIAMDDYFVDRKYTPIDDDGELDFENINAIDLELFDDHLAKITRGETIEAPIFDFHLGRRSDKTRTLKMRSNQILIVEGIHCLNERIAGSVPDKNKKRIYISALTQLNIDRFNPISSTDNRLIRRMTRDMQFRNTTPGETMQRWESGQKGESVNIFPFQENADYFINTALIYELAVLKPFIVPKLEQVTTKDKYYHETKRLLGILDFIKPADPTVVPPASLLREFIGGSPFFEE
ncbi:MAG: hypothetical protein Q4C00_01065 [Bacillota bacterium]|nr:hypothetical protein [Bacillota bacterium]